MESAQQYDVIASKAAAEGNIPVAEEAKKQSKATQRRRYSAVDSRHRFHSTATDIWSNLGYAYSECNDLDKADSCLVKAVQLKPMSPWHRDTLARLLLRRSQRYEAADARALEDKPVKDPGDLEKAKQFHEQAKEKRNAAIVQIDEAVRLDPSLLAHHAPDGNFERARLLLRRSQQYEADARRSRPSP